MDGTCRKSPERAYQRWIEVDMQHMDCYCVRLDVRTNCCKPMTGPGRNRNASQTWPIQHAYGYPRRKAAPLIGHNRGDASGASPPIGRRGRAILGHPQGQNVRLLASAAAISSISNHRGSFQTKFIRTCPPECSSSNVSSSCPRVLYQVPRLAPMHCLAVLISSVGTTNGCRDERLLYYLSCSQRPSIASC